MIPAATNFQQASSSLLVLLHQILVQDAFRSIGTPSRCIDNSVGCEPKFARTDKELCTTTAYFSKTKDLVQSEGPLQHPSMSSCAKESLLC